MGDEYRHIGDAVWVKNGPGVGEKDGRRDSFQRSAGRLFYDGDTYELDGALHIARTLGR